MTRADEILDFWLSEVGPDRWFDPDPTLDAAVAERFGEDVAAARSCALDKWTLHPRPALALLILLDQFPRHIWRGKPEAYASDPKALAAAKRSIKLGHDRKIPEPERQFFYMPMMHAETNADQDRCVRLILTRMETTADRTLPHAVAHRNIIRRFGRFPYRNATLGRPQTAEEVAWLAEGGYRA